jgi:hypothetical protein
MQAISKKRTVTLLWLLYSLNNNRCCGNSDKKASMEAKQHAIHRQAFNKTFANC